MPTTYTHFSLYIYTPGIKRKAAEGLGDLAGTGIILETPEEAALARMFLRIPEVLEDLEADLTPHRYGETKGVFFPSTPYFHRWNIIG